MKIKPSKLWDALSTSFWFIPMLMVLGAIALAIATIYVDHQEAELVGTLVFTYTRGPDGARAILSSIAGSMVTVATTAFSIVIVALQLASGQFGPRLIRNFIRDRGNQIVLGTFIATFVYCLLVLRTISGQEDEEFVPQLSVTFSVGLAIASIAVLIYFIDHSAKSIQAQNVIAQVGDDIDQTMKRLFPQRIGQSKKNEHEIATDIPTNFDDATSLKATDEGYIQGVDDQELIKIAQEYDLIVRLNYRPGDFIVKGSTLAQVFLKQQANKKLTAKLNEAFVFGKQRTEVQDLEFPINQLVEIAVRALSPGINDPFTAIICIDQLSASLCHLAQREIPSPYRHDDNKNLRVIAKPITFPDMVDAAFNQIRQYGQSSVGVTIRLLEALATIATHTHNKEYHAALLRQAQMIERGSHEAVLEELDKKDIQQRYLTVLKALEAG